MSFPKYPEYKDSGIPWVGHLPRHWDILPLKRDLAFLTSGSRGWADHYADDGAIFLRIGNLTRDQISLDLSDIQRVSVPDGSEGERTKVIAGDILFSITAFLGSVAVVPDGLETSYVSQHVALARIHQKLFLPTWCAYVTLSCVGKTYLETQGYGGTKIQLSLSDVANIALPTPPLSEQVLIVAFLDRETAKIDALVAEQEKLIKLLKEKRQSVISHAVTKGLDPNAPMKDSGVEWLGEVPEHWTVKRLKQVGKLIGGAGFPHEFQGQESEVLPFYKVGDIGRSPDDRTMKGSENTVSLETAESLRAKIIPEGSIVYAKIGAAMLLNRRRITEIQCCIDNNMTAFIPNRSLITTEWAFYWLCILDFGELANPGAVPSFSEGDQANLIILQPPVQEQIEIAELINGTNHKMSSLICEAQRAIDLLKERRSALISAAVTGKIDVRGLVDATQ